MAHSLPAPGQSLGSIQLIQFPAPSQTDPPLNVQVVPAGADISVDAPLLQTLMTH
jgi:hypothetical protein